MKKNGRPPLTDRDAVRTRQICVRLSLPEWENLQERAAHMGMQPATWLRTAALERRLPSAQKPPVPAVNREEYVELARLASNINQLAHAANEKRGFLGGSVKVDSELLERVSAELVRLRLALLGVADDEEGGGDDY